MFRWYLAGSFFLAAACTPFSEASVSANDTTIASPQAERVLAFGFEAIRERYLTPVVVSNLAQEGLRGLSSIDPSLTMERQAGHRLRLRYRDETIGEYPMPPNEDPRAWAHLVVEVAADATPHSTALHAIDREKLYEAVFDATLSKLDIFSRYAGAQEAAEHQAARNGFGGIGIRYELHPEDIVLTEVMPETPAAEADLKVGDHVTAIDNTSVAGLAQPAISKRLRGPVGTSVNLSVRKNGAAPTQVSLERSLIVPPTVRLAIKDGIGVLAITSFNSGTAFNVGSALKKARATPGFRGIILDLRGNPGGLLDQGVAVADLFIAHGRIVSAKGRHPASVQSYDAKSGDPGEDMPLVALIDGGTASAAEIVAGALQDSGRAVIVGTNSFGKGTVQTVVRMPNKGEMTLTWSRFHTPSGYALHGLGVLPTVCTVDERAQVATLTAPLRDNHPSVAANIALWRQTGIDDQQQRKQLRAVCPAAKHTDTALDVDVGRELIQDRALYTHALSLLAPQATASSAPIHKP
ncbi:S41 family peptidase [Telmatospirillum siberiense]|uniref:S41 family peptidase n=1 Tax=Telmatospirillum siberiense TaxID=382514 RepID=A0A2N3PM50_9PROT|nr:S41 family peptidase [Telmatospirillum siberiense]PKU21475.1 S41 family peptidase [Telmatospirillum siberiense]